MVKRILLLIVIIVFAKNIANAQDPMFTQFYANKLYLNPAFAGNEKCGRAQLNYRNQWPKLGQTYVTYAASYDQRVNFLNIGMGAQIYQDIQADGAVKTTSINTMYTYTVNVNRNLSIVGGLQVSYFQKALNMDYIFPDMLHPIYGPIFPTRETSVYTDTKKGYFDFSSGLLVFNRVHTFGIAVHHLTQPSESYRNSSDAVLPRKLTVNYGTQIPINVMGSKKGEMYLSPQVLYQRQRDFEQFNYGIYFSRKSIVAGFWLRQNFKFHYDSFAMIIGFIQAKFRVAYSYDLTVSKLRNQTLGAHEISIGYTFPCSQKKVKFRAISCPSF